MGKISSTEQPASIRRLDLGGVSYRPPQRLGVREAAGHKNRLGVKEPNACVDGVAEQPARLTQD